VLTVCVELLYCTSALTNMSGVAVYVRRDAISFEVTDAVGSWIQFRVTLGSTDSRAERLIRPLVERSTLQQELTRNRTLLSEVVADAANGG
jgi:hypothetical protein